MNVTFLNSNPNINSNNLLQIDDAHITFKNFEGRGDQYNREGDRNFSVIIDDPEIAEALQRDGWNVKIKAPREEGDLPRMTLKVKVKFNSRGPKIYLLSNGKQTLLSEDNVSCLDYADIISCDMDIRAYDWENNGKTGRTAYLNALRVRQNVDRFAMDFAEEEFPGEEIAPF